ncbi:MAG: ATP-binding protein [Flavobacteriaceae bacterium]|nr:ATP-binding protein [Flavobacteriaceae bacterium]
MQKIVLTGGPGTGKTTIIDELHKQGFTCQEEVSRQVTLMARENGIEQLFLKDPLLFSKLLLESRIQQFKASLNKKGGFVFFDRGIPDVHGYMNYLGIEYPKLYIKKSKKYLYDTVFLMPPWQKIYITDNERYESFEQSLAIHNHLKNTYKSLGYTIIDVPFGSVKERVDFILKAIG